MRDVTRGFKLFLFLAGLLLLAGQASPSRAQGGSITYLPLALKGFVAGPGTVQGVVLDATTRTPIPNVQVCWTTLCTYTNGSGQYFISDIPAGWRVLRAASADYYAAQSGVAVIGHQTVTLDFALSYRSLGDVDYRVVMTWDSTPYWPPLNVPNDLDAHLWLEAVLPYHLYYDNNPEDFLQYPYARLETDYTNGFGPETIDIERLVNYVTYHYAVDNVNYGYPGVPPLTQLGVQVQVYDADGLLQTFTVPLSGQGDVWYVFSMDDAGNLTEVNCLTYMMPNPDDPPQCQP